MTTAQQKIELTQSRIADNIERFQAVGVVYKLVLEGEGGGTWIASFKEPPTIKPGDGEAECTLTLAASDYVDMVDGTVNGEQLLFANKLKIDGDLELAIKLADVIDLMK